jgi:hypothetical protein
MPAMLVQATLGLALAASALQEGSQDPRATAVIERTHKTTAIYSVYVWTTIYLPGRKPIEEWAAEFHRGRLHRVETPRDRVVADCSAMTGAHLQVATGRIDRGRQYALMACGIDQGEILGSQWLGRGDTEFGPADRILIRRSDGERTYDVNDDGVLIGETISDESGELRLKNRAIDLLATLPSDDIFSEESLGGSAVAEEYKQEPAPKGSALDSA